MTLRALIAWVCLIITVALPKSLHAQENAEIMGRSEIRLKQLYASFGIGIPVPQGGIHPSCAATFMLSNRWGGSIRYSVSSYQSTALPGDYYPGGFFNWGGKPEDQINVLSLLLVHQWSTASRMVRYGVGLGPCSVSYDEHTFSPNPNQGWFGSNYINELTSQHSFGLSMRAYLQFPVGRAFGMEAGAFASVNGVQSTGALEACLDFGHMRKRWKR